MRAGPQVGPGRFQAGGIAEEAGLRAVPDRANGRDSARGRRPRAGPDRSQAGRLDRGGDAATGMADARRRTEARREYGGKGEEGRGGPRGRRTYPCCVRARGVSGGGGERR